MQQYTLKLTLTICALAGFWEPASCKSTLGYIVYKIYAWFLVSALYIFTVTQFMNIVLNVSNSDELIDSLYMMLAVIVAGYKQVYMWIDRKLITATINALDEEPFKPRESREIIIRRKFDKIIEDSTLRYTALVIAAVSTGVVTSVITNFAEGNLTYKAWIPFNYSNRFIYTIVYTHQLLGMITSAVVNVAFESLFCGFLVHMCCQIELLEHRLAKIAQDRRVLGDCVRHHNRIFEYANKVNNMFSKIIALQFTVSMLVVCSNLYQIATTDDYSKSVPVILYTGAMLAQIFIYCWFGNEVKLKSLQLMSGIFEIEWSGLSDSNKKALIIIMKRATVSIEFSSAHIITMNLDSFVALLKLSYSAFNLLHQSRE